MTQSRSLTLGVTLLSAGLLAAVAVAAVLARTHPIARESATPLQLLAGVRPLGANSTLDHGFVYGSTLGLFDTAPFGGFGSRWRVLGARSGSVTIAPEGRPSRYFALGFVVVAVHAPGRLALTDSSGGPSLFPVSAGAEGAEVVRAGPFRSSVGPSSVVQLSSEAFKGSGGGPTMLISPMQAWYLRPGEAVMRMPALQERARGVSGYPIPARRLGSFAVTPGVKGPVLIKLTEVSNSPGSQIQISGAGVTRTIAATGSGREEIIGPISAPVESIGVKLAAPVSAGPTRWLMISDLRIQSVAGGRHR